MSLEHHSITGVQLADSVDLLGVSDGCVVLVMSSSLHAAGISSRGDGELIQDAARSGRLADLERLLDAKPANDLRKHLVSALACAAVEGHTNVVDSVIRRLPNFSLRHPEFKEHVLLAVRAGHCGVVDRLLRGGWSMSLLDTADVIAAAACHGQLAVMQLLLAEPWIRLNLMANGCVRAIGAAASYGHAAIVELLLHPSTMPASEGDVREQANLRWRAALRHAALCGHAGLVRRLIAGVTVAITALAEDAVAHASSSPIASAAAGAARAAAASPPQLSAPDQSGDANVSGGSGTTVLCEPLQAMDGEFICEIIRAAAQYNRIAVVDLLLQQAALLGGDQGTADACSAALCGFAAAGNVARVRELLQQPLVDPTVDNRRVIVDAAHSGFAPVVAALLADPRVDPDGGDGVALDIAVEQGCAPVVDLLLQHPGLPVGDGGYDSDGHGDALGLSHALDVDEGASRSREFMRLHTNAHGRSRDEFSAAEAGAGGSFDCPSAGSCGLPCDSCELLPAPCGGGEAGCACSSGPQVGSVSDPPAESEAARAAGASRPFTDSDSEDSIRPGPGRDDAAFRKERRRRRAARGFAAAVPPGCIDATMRLLLQPSFLRSRLPCYRSIAPGCEAAHCSEFKATWRHQLRRWPGSRLADLGWLAWRRRMPVVAARTAAFASVDAEMFMQMPGADGGAADVHAHAFDAGARPPWLPSTPPY